MSQSTKLLYALALVLLFLGGLSLAKYAPWADKSTANAGYTNLGGDFTLNSKDGEVSLEDYRGQVVLMYFGFTSCPDVCPTALSSIAASMRQLTPNLEAQIQPLFVSVDPGRDTLDNLAIYSAYFHPRMLGITGSIEAIDEIVKKYGAYYSHIPLENSALAYTVDHTSRAYLIGTEGQLISTVAHGTSVDELVALLKQHL